MTEMVDNLILKEYADDIVVIPIVGMGGLGKTTLAQSLFNCKEITDHFEPMIWVDGSREDDVKSIVKKIVISQTNEKCDHLEMESLKKLLWKVIEGKKYLIVMDDIWNDNRLAWNELKDLLVVGAKGSRLIVTTRNLRVAEATRPGCTFKLNELSEDDSLELFKLFASNDGDEWTYDHQTIGKQIVAKCFGVPLAIKSLGLLLHSESLNEWRRMEDKELKNIDQSEGNIMSILQLSYNHLPSHLKACFLFCGMFPAGKTIDVVELVDLWQASGLIQKSKDEDNYEDIGKGYVWDLIRSSLLDHVRDDEWDRIKFAKMHDLIYDLCNALSKEHILVDNEGEQMTNNISHLRLLRCNVDWKVPLAMLRAKRKLKTLILEKQSDQKQCELIVDSFKKLRILDIRSFCGSKPSSIGGLVHLRYLNLSWLSCKRLPESITDLWHLQVLKLDFCTNLQTLPKGMRKMINLMKLSFQGVYKLNKMPKGIGKLTHLCQLSEFMISKEETCASLEELRGLLNLRGTLMISNLVHAGKCEGSILEKTNGVVELLLLWNTGSAGDIETMNALKPHDNLKKLTVWGYGSCKFSDWLFGLQALSYLVIDHCSNVEELSHIHLLPSLQCLSIIEVNMEYIESCGCDKVYKSLQYLDIRECRELKGWCSSGSMVEFPVTITVQVKECPEFEWLSDGKEEVVNLGGCPKLNMADTTNAVAYQKICLKVNVNLTDAEDLVQYDEFISGIHGVDWHKVVDINEGSSNSVIFGVTDPEIILNKLKKRGYFAEILSITPWNGSCFNIV